jgi:hypothetical protein
MILAADHSRLHEVTVFHLDDVGQDTAVGKVRRLDFLTDASSYLAVVHVHVTQMRTQHCQIVCMKRG